MNGRSTNESLSKGCNTRVQPLVLVLPHLDKERIILHVEHKEKASDCAAIKHAEKPSPINLPGREALRRSRPFHLKRPLLALFSGRLMRRRRHPPLRPQGPTIAWPAFARPNPDKDVSKERRKIFLERVARSLSPLFHPKRGR